MSELNPCEAIEILEDIYPSKRQIVTGEYPQVAEALDMAISALRHAEPANEPLTPCDACRYSPPSSCDGKPCVMCPASGKPEGSENNA